MINSIDDFVAKAEAMIEEIESIHEANQLWRPTLPEPEPGIVYLIENHDSLHWIEGYDSKKFTIKLMNSSAYNNVGRFGMYLCNGKKATVDDIRKSLQRIRTRHANVNTGVSIEDDLDFQFTDDDYDLMYDANSELFDDDNLDPNLIDDADADIPSIEL